MAPHTPAPHEDVTRERSGSRTAAATRAFTSPSHDTVAFPFVAGRAELAVRLTSRPLFDLRRRDRIGVHVSRNLSRAAAVSGPFGGARPRLEVPDIQRLDAETLSKGLGLLGPREPGAVVSPVCWSTVASSRGRFSILYAGLDHEPDHTRLLIEITGVPENTTLDDLGDIAAHIEAQQRGVLVRTPGDPRRIGDFSRAGIRGLSLDLSRFDLRGAGGQAQAWQLIRTMRASAANLLVLGLPAALAEDAARAGATHAVMEERFTVTV